VAKENFLFQQFPQHHTLPVLELVATNGEVEVESIMPISRSSDFTNDFPPLTAAERKFYLFRCGNGRCECGSDTRLLNFIADCRRGLSSTGRKQACGAVAIADTYGKAIVIQLLVKIEP